MSYSDLHWAQTHTLKNNSSNIKCVFFALDQDPSNLMVTEWKLGS